jgi:RHS repeat-associated protein
MFSINKKYLVFVYAAVMLSTKVLCQNINTPNKQGPLGTEVNTLSGNLFLTRNDVYVPSRGVDINGTFYYNSFNFDQNIGFGNGWNFMYNIFYKIDTAGGKTIFWGDAREDRYKFSASVYKASNGIFDKLTEYQAGKFLITQLDGIKYYFDNATHKKVTKIEEPNGNFLTFTYTDTLLTKVTNTAGQFITFAYNGTGNLQTITDALTSPTRICTYTYDAAKNLKQVTDPLGGQTKYTYLVNGPMKTLSDKNNNIVDIIYYGDYTVSELIGCNKRQSFSYDTTLQETSVTDYVPNAENQVTKYQYKTFDNISWITGMTGNCCGYNMTFEYDSKGNKIKEKDANGNITTYTYDNNGNMLTMTDALNQTMTYTYSADYNRVTSYTDAKGFTSNMTYDVKGNLIQLVEPGNLIYTSTFNASGDIISSTDPKGNVFTYNYDALGNPTNVTGPNGYNATLGYDARGNLLAYTDARNNTSTMEYDILDRMKKITDPINNNLQLTYDAEGNATIIKNKNAENSLIKYDASNRITQLTDEMGNKTNLTYDAMDNITSIKNAVGAVTSFGYDKRNRISNVRDALGNSSSFTYDAKGNITSAIMPTGKQANYTYDALDRVKTITDNTGAVAQLAYDKNNNITSIVNGTGATTLAEYDSLDRPKKIIDPLGNAIQMAYDKNSNIIYSTDRNGNTSTYTYDSLNRVKTITDNNGSITTIGYDVQGNVVSLKDANNNITVYTYDALNRVKRTTYPDAKFMEYTYDAKENITIKRLTDGTNINFTYDSLNRVISKLLPDGQNYTYTYDAISRVKTATNNAGTVTLNYDLLNRVVSETYNGRTVNYAYNTAGRTQTTIYPDSTTITKLFDTRNRLISISKNGNNVVNYTYNNANQAISKTLANGVVTTMQYDNANRLINYNTANGTIQNTNISYDNNWNKTALTRVNAPTKSEQYLYDNGNRLTNFKRGVAGSPVLQNTYTYDALGNRTNANLNGTNTSYSTNNLNQLTNSNNGAQNINFTYDNRGNLTYDGKYYKTYDAEGRLLKDSASLTNKLTYLYDAFGRRTQKSLNGNILNYTFAGLSQIEERDGAGIIKNKTIFSNFLMPISNEKNGANYFYHQNELGSVEAISNSSGRTMEKYEYDVYGKQNIFDSLGNPLTGSITGNRFGYTGQVYDSATASNKFLFREYNPATGTFNERDLIGYGDGMGMYQYVGNNPANGIDVFGLEEGPFVRDKGIPNPDPVMTDLLNSVLNTTYAGGKNTKDLQSLINGSLDIYINYKNAFEKSVFANFIKNNPALLRTSALLKSIFLFDKLRKIKEELEKKCKDWKKIGILSTEAVVSSASLWGTLQKFGAKGILSTGARRFLGILGALDVVSNVTTQKSLITNVVDLPKNLAIIFLTPIPHNQSTYYSPSYEYSQMMPYGK